MPTWPASLPQAALLGTLTMAAEEIRSISRPDIGPPVVRLNGAVAGEIFSFEMMMTGAQLATLTTCWEDTLNNGAETFDWSHPVTEATENFLFINPPEITQRTDVAFVVKVRLYQVPTLFLLISGGDHAGEPMLFEDGFGMLIERAA